MRSIIKTKKGVSPMVSTVLLIMIVIIIAIIILIWGRGWIKEKLLKFNEPVENACARVSIKPFVNPVPGDSYGFTNTGNTPIYQTDVKITTRGRSSVTRDKQSANPGVSVILGNSYSSDTNIEEIKIIPILLGKTSSGKQKEYTCPEQNAVVV